MRVELETRAAAAAAAAAAAVPLPLGVRLAGRVGYPVVFVAGPLAGLAALGGLPGRRTARIPLASPWRCGQVELN